MSSRPLVAIVGLSTESSTFTPGVTGLDDFVVARRDQIFARYPFLAEGSEVREAAVWLPVLVGDALPGPPVSAQAYEHLVDEMLAGLAALPALDGVLVDLHGAMSVEGLDDPEGDLVERIRAVVGETTMLSSGMDLHGNVSRRLVAGLDLITCYRMAPHEDTHETRERAARNLLDRIASGIRPHKAWVPIPVLLPGEKTSTRIEPGSGIYAEVSTSAERAGVLDAAIWIGYAWADGHRNQAYTVVTGDDEQVIVQEAERLAEEFWRRREEFAFVAPTASLEECLAVAEASSAKPFFISDTGDNPTAGGSGDVTWTLARLLERPQFETAEGPAVIYASIPGRSAVETAEAAGVGSRVRVIVGGLVDSVHEGPLAFEAEVMGIYHGDPVAGTIAVLRRGSIDVIVTSRRKPYHHRADFTALGLEPTGADIVFVKIGYLEPELFDMSEGWMMALTPGGVDQNIERLHYEHIQRPMFPFDRAFQPPLEATLLPARVVAGDSGR